MNGGFGMKGLNIVRFGYRIIGALLALGMLHAAFAQDFPTLKGDAVRTGKSSNFLASGPDIGALTWYRPNPSDNAGKNQQIDNAMRPTGTDPAYTAATGTWLGYGDLN